jgi:hypothetical protein
LKNNQSTDEKLCQKEKFGWFTFCEEKNDKVTLLMVPYQFTSLAKYRINLLISMSGKNFFGILKKLIWSFDAFLLIVVLLFVVESKRNVT